MEVIVSKKVSDDEMKIRMDVFSTEQGYVEGIDEIDERSSHVLIYIDEKAVATGRVFLYKDKTYKLGRIAVRKECRKQNLGRVLVDELEKVALELGAEKTALSSQYPARGFYQKCGYEIVGESYIEDGTEHIFMTKNLL